MAFNVSSKFIGNKRLVGSQAIPAIGLTKRGWFDSFVIDTVGGAGPYTLWTKSTVGTGDAVYNALGATWTIQMFVAADADEISLTSKSALIPSSIGGWVATENTLKFTVDIFNWSGNSPAVADQLIRFGFYLDATHYILLKNVAANTWQLAVRDGGAEVLGTSFTEVQPAQVAIEVTDVTSGTPTVRVYTNDGTGPTLRDTLVDAAVPVGSGLSAYILSHAVVGLNSVTFDIQGITFEVL